MTESYHVEAVRLGGPCFQHDPAEVYRRMRREHGPVAPVLLESDVFAWLVLGYRELRYVTSAPDLFSRDSRRWNAWDTIPPDWPLLPVIAHQPSVWFADGVEHERRASAIQDALADVDQFQLRAQCERIADQLVDSFVGVGEADLVAQYAQLIPLLVCGTILGLSDDQAWDHLRDLKSAVDGAPDAVEAYGRSMARMRQLLEDRKAQPCPDVPSRLLAHPSDLGVDELLYDLVVVVGAAYTNTTNWIGNTLRLMLTDDRFATTLSGGRRSVGQALKEVLWEDTITQNLAGRWALRATQLGGQHIRAGDMLVLSYAAANTDPHIRPDSCADISGNNAYTSFSHGEHRCPYAAQEIAETMAQISIEVLLDRLPDMTLAVPAAELVWRPSVWVRGLTALPVTFRPR